MEIITYSLKGNNTDSDTYYYKITGFTDKVLQKGAEFLREYVSSYHTGIGDVKISFDEGVLELLILGVYWNNYSGSACTLAKIPSTALNKLSQNHQKGTGFITGINFLKGMLSTIFLLGKNRDSEVIARPDLVHMDKLLAWLEAAGEFKQEAKRLKNWRNYLSQLDSKAASKVISASIKFADWFKKESVKELGQYTYWVEQYLESKWSQHKWKEDVIFCGRKRSDYHLNMVGAEILNRVYKNEFLRKDEKVLIIPTCMRRPGNMGCKAKQFGKGLVCSHCSKECPVYKLSEMGKYTNLKLRMVPHESSIASTKTDNSLFNSNTGVIGVSCILNLISGGWMLVDKGVAPQCVLLDYCGCQNHWHDKGFSTEINEKQLLRVLGVGV